MSGSPDVGYCATCRLIARLGHDQLCDDCRSHTHRVQAHADQQARLRGLVGTWQSRTEQCIEQAEKAKSRTERESWISTEIATRKCADELEAVLGGKEND